MRAELARYLPTFVLVAEDLSFSKTARRLGLTPAAVSKSVRTLEQGLGLRLFHRSTHALSLTAEGERLRHSVTPLLDALDQSLESVTNLPDRPRGLLRVAAPYAIGKQDLLPLLGEFRCLYPEVELDLRFDDHVVDQVKEQIDVALGMRTDPNPNLIAKKLFDTQLIVVASPKFLEQHDAPTHPRDVERFPCVRYRDHASGRLFPWRFRDPYTEETLTLNPAAAITASSLELVAELAAAGHGLALNGSTSAAPYLRSGKLVQVLADYAHPLPPVMLYYASKRNLPSRVRAFIDFVSQRLGAA
jgi:DNA-binding transcriptional LysR family regulator